jgi:hypothetical protein
MFPVLPATPILNFRTLGKLLSYPEAGSAFLSFYMLLSLGCGGTRQVNTVTIFTITVTGTSGVNHAMPV